MGECKGQPLSEELDIRGPSVGPVPSHLFPVFCGERPSDLLLSLFILSYLCRLTCLLRFSSPLFIKIDQDPSLTTIFFSYLACLFTVSQTALLSYLTQSPGPINLADLLPVLLHFSLICSSLSSAAVFSSLSVFSGPPLETQVQIWSSKHASSVPHP